MHTAPEQIYLIASTLSALATIVLVSVIAWFDHQEYRIPNRAVCALGLSGLLFAALRSILDRFIITDTWPVYRLEPQLGGSVAGGIVAFMFCYAFWRIGKMGGGDLKLASALGFTVGLLYVMQILVVAHVLAFAVVCWDRLTVVAKSTFLSWRGQHSGRPSLDSTPSLAMGPFYAASVLFLFLGELQ
jgi:Flp pilus assembly protein protease CpaA